MGRKVLILNLQDMVPDFLQTEMTTPISESTNNSKLWIKDKTMRDTRNCARTQSHLLARFLLLLIRTEARLLIRSEDLRIALRHPFRLEAPRIVLRECFPILFLPPTILQDNKSTLINWQAISNGHSRYLNCCLKWLAQPWNLESL